MKFVDGLANVAGNRSDATTVRVGCLVESFQFGYSRTGAQIVKFFITGSLAPEAAEITTISPGVGQAYIQDRNMLKFYPGTALSV